MLINEKVPSGPDYPDVFLQQMRREARLIRGDIERVKAFFDRELKVLRHVSPKH